MAPLHLADQPLCQCREPHVSAPLPGSKAPMQRRKNSTEAVDRTAPSWCGLDVLKLIFYIQEVSPDYWIYIILYID